MQLKPEAVSYTHLNAGTAAEDVDLQLEDRLQYDGADERERIVHAGNGLDGVEHAGGAGAHQDVYKRQEQSCNTPY